MGKIALAKVNGEEATSSGSLITGVGAEASTTEEPDEGKLHVRDCVGGVG